jgi:hypothetical protein
MLLQVASLLGIDAHEALGHPEAADDQGAITKRPQWWGKVLMLVRFRA